MSGTVNTVKGDSTVPMKFQLFKGSTELTDTASVNPLAAKEINCSALGTVVTDDIEVLATGGTSLRYSGTPGIDGQFIYNWQTPKTVGKCYSVTVTAKDGSSQTALFKTK